MEKLNRILLRAFRDLRVERIFAAERGRGGTVAELSWTAGMKFEIVTIFPDFFRGPLDYGIVRKAREAKLIEIAIHDLREFTHDRHRTVDDRPFGGGEGMVLKPEPIFECLGSLGVAPREERVTEDARESVVLLSPQGQMFTQTLAQQLIATRANRADLRPL